jgi:hemimethylated DNA binding protein
VGQVIRHKVNGYRGVIIGWDERAKAPEWWLEKVHRGHADWADLPNYTVLIDTRGLSERKNKNSFFHIYLPKYNKYKKYIENSQ